MTLTVHVIVARASPTEDQIITTIQLTEQTPSATIFAYATGGIDTDSDCSAAFSDWEIIITTTMPLDKDRSSSQTTTTPTRIETAADLGSSAELWDGEVLAGFTQSGWLGPRDFTKMDDKEKRLVNRHVPNQASSSPLSSSRVVASASLSNGTVTSAIPTSLSSSSVLSIDRIILFICLGVWTMLLL